MLKSGCQWIMDLNAGKASTLLFQHSAHHTTRQGHLLRYHHPNFSTSLSTPLYPSLNYLYTITNRARHRQLYLPPPMDHLHPLPSDCLTYTSALYFSTVSQRYITNILDIHAMLEKNRRMRDKILKL